MPPDPQAEALHARLVSIEAELERIAEERKTSLARVAAEVINTFERASSAGFMRAKPV